jgi:2-polyprenyl-3-methyl-5-hydroxy-6-metoxy-1,4-benzoquinol methylase
VLDLGCGAGQLSLHLAEAGAAEVIAMDISTTMLELARVQRSHPQVSYRLERHRTRPLRRAEL